MKSVLVYCGSHSGKSDIYRKEAVVFGQMLAKHELRLVYGGGNSGIMGAISNAILDAGGVAIGIRPENLLQGELANQRCTELISVKNMQDRKVLLEQKADFIVALPGGYGTMDELFESLTNVQIGIHQKPIFLLNTNGFYNHIILQLDKMVEEGFITYESHKRLRIVSNPEEIIQDIIHGKD